jgi:PAS domain S-box-containing protein
MLGELIKYFEMLYDNLRNPVQVVDDEGKIVYVNEAFVLVWGYHINELSEYSVFTDTTLKDNGIFNLITEVISGTEYRIINNYSDSLLNSKDDATPILRTCVFPLNHFGHKYLVLFHEDITDMVLTEEEVKKAREVNKESERLKNNFLNVLSHELRTPLNIILGYSSLIKDNLADKIGAEEKIYLDNLHSGSERLFKSITQMLEFAQLESGNYTMNIETIDIIGFFQSCLPNHKKSAQEKNIQVRTNFTNKKVYVDVDLHCVENAFNSLISNAIKFTHQGFVEIEVELLEERDLAVCRVKDSGVGISTNYLDHLYQPFSQEDLNIGRNFEGNGLGLALAKRYIERLGGSLLVDSIKGVGTTFTFTLPLTQNLNYRRKIHSTDDIPSYVNKILMLDDAGDSFELIKAFLKKEYEVINYSIRDFKLEYIRDINFNYIIFDVNKNYWQQGMLICKDIKKNDPYKRPIIIISSEYVEEKIKEFFNAGAKKFLVKPFGRSELVNVLKEASN